MLTDMPSTQDQKNLTVDQLMNLISILTYERKEYYDAYRAINEAFTSVTTVLDQQVPGSASSCFLPTYKFQPLDFLGSGCQVCISLRDLWSHSTPHCCIPSSHIQITSGVWCEGVGGAV